MVGPDDREQHPPVQHPPHDAGDGDGRQLRRRSRRRPRGRRSRPTARRRWRRRPDRRDHGRTGERRSAVDPAAVGVVAAKVTAGAAPHDATRRRPGRRGRRTTTGTRAGSRGRAKPPTSTAVAADPTAANPASGLASPMSCPRAPARRLPTALGSASLGGGAGTSASPSTARPAAVSAGLPVIHPQPGRLGPAAWRTAMATGGWRASTTRPTMPSSVRRYDAMSTACPAVVQLDVLARSGSTTIRFGAHPVRALGARGLPVREVRRLHEDRRARLGRRRSEMRSSPRPRRSTPSAGWPTGIVPRRVVARRRPAGHVVGPVGGEGHVPARRVDWNQAHADRRSSPCRRRAVDVGQDRRLVLERLRRGRASATS